MAKAEDEWSDDCSDIWNFDDVCSTLISEHFTLVLGIAGKRRSIVQGWTEDVPGMYLRTINLGASTIVVKNLQIARGFCESFLRGK